MEDNNKNADEIKPYLFEPLPKENTAKSGSSGSLSVHMPVKMKLMKN